MEREDPEERIAELERRLAEQNHVDNRTALTPEEVHNLAFSNPTGGDRGYHEGEVDAFLDRIEATLRDPMARGGLTAADVRNVTFSKPPIGMRGYNKDEVDAFLVRVEAELARRAGQPSAVDPGARHLRHSDESTRQTIFNEARAFWAEFSNGRYGPVTWRWPLVLAVPFVFLGCAVHPAYLVVAACLLIWAAFAWHSGRGA